MRNTNILFFVTTLQSGGIQNYLLRFLKIYATQFKNVYVYCKGGRGGDLEQDYNSFKNVIIVKNKISLFDLNKTKKIKHFYLSHNINAVCDFTGNFAGIPLRVAQKVNISKRVAFYRRSTNAFKEDYIRLKYNNWLNKLVYKNATDILANSSAGLSFFFEDKWLNDKRFEVIYNGIDIQAFLIEKNDLREKMNIPKNAFVVGHTGRYDKAKNHKSIIEVAKKLTQKYDDIYFILCGNGVKENIQSQLTKKESAKILLFENRRDIPLFLNVMNCYFFPSVTEGQPNALIEAMISGLPIVASNIEPIKEAMPPVIHPYLIPPFDCQKAKEQILAIRSNSDFKFKMIHTDWAKKQFEARKQFGKFFRKLR